MMEELKKSTEEKIKLLSKTKSAPFKWKESNKVFIK
jgi:hypothetical protein